MPVVSQDVLASYIDAYDFFITVKIDIPTKYADEVDILKHGMHNQLVISFESDQVFLPLKLSSLNRENMIITVYVFGREPFKDITGLLRITEWKPARYVIAAPPSPSQCGPHETPGSHGRFYRAPDSGWPPRGNVSHTGGHRRIDRTAAVHLLQRLP